MEKLMRALTILVTVGLLASGAFAETNGIPVGESAIPEAPVYNEEAQTAAENAVAMAAAADSAEPEDAPAIVVEQAPAPIDGIIEGEFGNCSDEGSEDGIDIIIEDEPDPETVAVGEIPPYEPPPVETIEPPNIPEEPDIDDGTQPSWAIWPLYDPEELEEESEAIQEIAEEIEEILSNLPVPEENPFAIPEEELEDLPYYDANQNGQLDPGEENHLELVPLDENYELPEEGDPVYSEEEWEELWEELWEEDPSTDSDGDGEPDITDPYPELPGE